MRSTALFRDRLAVFRQLFQPQLNGFTRHVYCMIKRYAPRDATGQCRNGHGETALLQWREIDCVSYPFIYRQYIYISLNARQIHAGVTYLAERRALHSRLRSESYLLLSFARYADRRASRGWFTNRLANV
jgi:hypothetical protein